MINNKKVNDPNLNANKSINKVLVENTDNNRVRKSE